ncbi:MAG: FAD-dependent oxidoreductase, partial [Chloroflexi bacterium]|nr:FAD-dependent oxidoreductase [Chloroflexota bacterium]
MTSRPDHDVEVAVIGAGALGTAVAAALAPDYSVLVVERHEGSGRETSSHNSGVIHAGIYYPTGSLKHRSCIEGNALLYEWCEARNVVHRCCGKLIVALAEDEIDGLDAVVEQARANGVPGISRLTGREARALEPAVPAAAALLSESSGVVDQAGLVRSFEGAAIEGGALFAYQHEVLAAERDAAGFRLELRDADGQRSDLRSTALVNAAGHGAPRIAAALGYPLD